MLYREMPVEDMLRDEIKALKATNAALARENRSLRGEPLTLSPIEDFSSDAARMERLSKMEWSEKYQMMVERVSVVQQLTNSLRKLAAFLNHGQQVT